MTDYSLVHKNTPNVIWKFWRVIWGRSGRMVTKTFRQTSRLQVFIVFFDWVQYEEENKLPAKQFIGLKILPLMEGLMDGWFGYMQFPWSTKDRVWTLRWNATFTLWKVCCVMTGRPPLAKSLPVYRKSVTHLIMFILDWVSPPYCQ